MKIILNNNSLFKSLRPFNDIGFVPTMGSIHEGHLSLIDRSNRTCKKTIVSIFVNPKQFNNKKDFKNYPINIKEDIKILKKTKKVDFLYIPKFKDIYNNNKKSNIKIANKDVDDVVSRDSDAVVRGRGTREPACVRARAWR